MKLLLMGDVHFSDVFLHRKDNVRDTFAKKFTWLRRYAKENDVAAILCTGDIFHYKYPARTSHSLMQFVVRLIKDLPCPFYTNVGNHDISYNDIATLPRQPLGVLGTTDTIRILGVYPTVIGDTEVWGISYGADLSQIDLPPRKCKNRIVVLHTFLASDPGFFYGGERIWSFSELLKFDADLILNGHDHKGYDPVLLGKTAFYRPPAMFRYARNETDLTRKVSVVLTDTEDLHLADEILVPHEPAQNVFHITEKINREWSRNSVASFVTDLGDFKLMKPGALSEDVAKMDLPVEVKQELEIYLESAK